MSIQTNKLPDNPNIDVIKAGKTGLFTNYIYKAIPLAFDESMSYYETLLGLLHYLKNVILPTVNNNADAVAELQTLYEELRKYVDDYFKDLDVQEEINNKLDEMVEDGTLDQIIQQYLSSSAIWGFDTVADMKNATNLINGSYAQTLGYYNKNDGGSTLYKISETEPSTDYYETLNNGLYAIMIINNKTINSLQFGIKSDNETDDLLNLQKMITFINNYNDYLNVIFDGNNTMKFSDTLFINKSNLKISLKTNLQLTKTVNLSSENSLKGIQIGNNNDRLSNIIIDGNNYYIDGNGLNVTNNASTTSGLFNAKTLFITNVDNIKIKNLIVKNGYKDCCGLTNCTNGLIDNCIFSYSYRDNGLSIDSSELSNPLPVIISNCKASHCHDLGFSTWYGKNILFNNCYAEYCGNTGATDYDNTYVSAGGGYSSEVPSSAVETQTSDISTSFINCTTNNCYNYGFYFNTRNVLIDGCSIKNITSTGTTEIRYGNAIICEDIIDNEIIKNCNIFIDNINNGIRCIGYNQTELFTPQSNINIENCNISGHVLNAIISLTKTLYTKILNCDLSNCSTELYGIRFLAQSTTYPNKELYIKNININNIISGNNCEKQYYDSITQNIGLTEDDKYGIHVFRGITVSFTNILSLNANDIEYAIRAGGASSGQAFTNVYKGNILTNLANDVDSGTHS